LKSRKLKVNPIVAALFSTILFFACSNRPSHVLSEKKMEKVLYDLYLAEAEISANYTVFSSDSARKSDLLNSVLKKHKITEAVLDTSLAWYSGNLERYLKINDNLNKRFTEEAEALGRREGKGKAKSGFVDLPVKEKFFLLSSTNLLSNASPFKADTILNLYGGAYQLQFSVLGISTPPYPIVTLCVQCADTVFVKRDTISRNGLFMSFINILQVKQAKNLYGSFYFPEITSRTNVFIHDFELSYSHSSLSPNSLFGTQPAK